MLYINIYTFFMYYKIEVGILASSTPNDSTINFNHLLFKNTAVALMSIHVNLLF